MKFTKREPKSDGNKPNLFLQLKNGESATGVLRGEIYEFFIKWVNGKSEQVRANDPEGKSRFKVNIVVNEEGKFVAKIWEFSFFVYNDLANIASEYDITKTKIKITRNGSGTETRYLILPLLKEPLGPKAMEQIEAVKLNILNKDKPNVDTYSPGENDFGEPPVETDEDIPF